VADSAWIGVVGALGGIALTGLVGLGSAALTHRRDEDTRRRTRENDLARDLGALRRDAYVRYLISAQTLGDVVLSSPPTAPGQLDVTARLEALKAEKPAPFAEYDAAQALVRLLAGPSVNEAVDVYEKWIRAEVRAALSAEDPVRSKAFFGWAKTEAPLTDSMRRELDQAFRVE
jgi:hypothetical protein